jgi:hypothetical protein
VTTMVVGNSSSRITSPAFETPLWWNGRIEK